MKYTLIFFLILICASVVRLVQLGNLPSGLTWDEAAIGYNAYGIATVHRDEWLHRMPIVFQSFGDYKSPLLVYCTAVLLLFAPVSETLVRLPIALSGIFLVLATYLVTREVFYFHKHKDVLSLCSMFLVAISPWAITFSRVGFESMLAATLFTFGVFCWLAGIRLFQNEQNRKGRLAWIVGDVLLSLSLYAYHSSKVVVPLFIVLFLFCYRKIFLQHLRSALLGTAVSLIVLLPLIYTSVFGQANSRALSTTIIGKPHLVTTFISHVTTHLSLPFLLFGRDITYRQSTMQMGVLYPLELALFITGICAIIAKKQWRQYIWIPLLFIFGILPASLGIDVPHSNRAVLALPWAQVTAAFGLFYLIEQLKDRKLFLVQQVVFYAIPVLFLLQFFAFVRVYVQTYKTTLALSDFGYGMEYAITYARRLESTVDIVYFTNDRSQAYIYILFFKHMNPIDFRGGGRANYVISENPYTDARGHARVLIVGTPEDLPNTIPPEKVIKYPDGTDAFVIIRQ